MKKVYFTLLILAISAGFVTEADGKSPSDYRYKVVYVLDGDTFSATDGNIEFRVRIAAMDAPEKGQPYSKMATYRLKSLILDKEVSIIPTGKGYDRYGRVLGEVHLDGKDIALDMIGEGLAVYYRPFCKNHPADKNKYNYNPKPYIAVENEAQKSKKNMWTNKDFMLPCKYRQIHRN